jgi:hypothetical protein
VEESRENTPSRCRCAIGAFCIAKIGGMKKLFLTGIAMFFLATGAVAQVSIRTTIVKPFKTIPPDLSPLPDQGIIWPRPLPKPLFNMPRDLAERLRLVPPQEYDHEYTGTLRIIRTTQTGVWMACQDKFKSVDQAIGCADAKLTEPRACVIWIVNDSVLEKLGWDYDIVFRHERGHCNGWRHDN